MIVVRRMLHLSLRNSFRKSDADDVQRIAFSGYRFFVAETNLLMSNRIQIDQASLTLAREGRELQCLFDDLVLLLTSDPASSYNLVRTIGNHLIGFAFHELRLTGYLAATPLRFTPSDVVATVVSLGGTRSAKLSNRRRNPIPRCPGRRGGSQMWGFPTIGWLRVGMQSDRVKDCRPERRSRCY